MRYWIILILAVTAIVGDPSWLTGQPYLVRALAYPLFHANVFHLAANSLAVWSIFRPGRKDNARLLVIGYAISVLVYGCSIRPMIGISNLLYAAIGMGTPLYRWRNPALLTFLAVTFVMVFIPSISGISHIVSLVAGIMAGEALAYIDRTAHEAERAAGR